MHPYSIDEKRIKVLREIGGISFISSYIILKIANGLVDDINSLLHINNIPYIPQMATFGAVFLVLFYLFDRILWKISIAGFQVSKIPNLSGEWKGKLKTSHESGKEIDINVNIKQTWSSILIVLETEHSKSKSEVASIMISKSRLVYQYFNEPSFTSPETLCMHYGITFLDFEGDILKGRYFTDRDRKNYGDIHLERIDS